MTKQLLCIAATCCLCSVLIAGCSSAQSDWDQASSKNTVSAYQSFIAAHPQDSHASEAKAMILQIQDNNAWQEAQNAGSNASYQTYLQQYPQGTHATDARNEITRMDRAAGWKSAQEAGTAAAVEAFLQKYSTGPEVEQAQAKLKELSGYRIHLADEPTDAKAQRRISQLKSRLGAEAPDLSATPNANGQSFSVDSAGMSEQAAQSACIAIHKKHVACQVVNR